MIIKITPPSAVEPNTESEGDRTGFLLKCTFSASFDGDRWRGGAERFW